MSSPKSQLGIQIRSTSRSLVRQSNSQIQSTRQTTTSGKLQRRYVGSGYKPLLHILDHGEKPGDMVRKPKQVALHGQMDVYIARAEIELRSAMQSLAFMTYSEINSVPTLTALSLPKIAAPLFWTINAFLQGKYQRSNDRGFMHHRNHDARLLYQQLAKLDLMPWSARSVDYVRPENLPDDAVFPVGHPIAGRTYRRHPFKSRLNHYFPVTDYFSMLYKEREQALMALLGDLGATKISMMPIPKTDELDCKTELAAQLRKKVFKYPERLGEVPEQINIHRHPWLAGEPEWQEVVTERLRRGAISAQFELDNDVMGMLKSQIKMIGQLIPGLDSMQLPDNHKEVLIRQLMQTRRVEVEFSELA